jgi:hypothetical protein
MRATSGASRPRNSQVVEDFESYDDADNRIYETWLDG